MTESDQEPQARFLQLFVEHEDSLRVFVRSLLFSRDEEREVMQDVAAVLWQKFDASLDSQAFGRWSFGLGFAVLGVALLSFLVPLPKVALDPCDRLFQQASAEVSYWAMQLTGTPVSRNGLVFQLPGLTIEFVQECGGARSTFVLLMVGVVLARLVLIKTLNRAILVMAIIPLWIVQKGVWIYIFASLAVQNLDIINTWVHYRGEAICFALSLISLIGLLWVLHRSEHAQGEKATHSCQR